MRRGWRTQNKPSQEVVDALDAVAEGVPVRILLRFAVTKAGLARLARLVRTTMP